MQKVQYIDINKLSVRPDNPRLIKDVQFEKLCESLKNNKDFFETRPILANPQMVVFAGNMRLRAAKEIGMEEVPVAVMDISEERQKEIMVRDNRSAGEWDWNILANTYNTKFLFDVGFTAGELGFISQQKDNSKEDEIPKKESETKTKVGDIYELKNGDLCHRILCGDSTNDEHVFKLMNKKQAELLFTSPPYSDLREYRGGKNLDVSSLTNFIKAFKPFVHYMAVNLGIQVKKNELLFFWQEYLDKAKECGLKLLSWNVWDQGGAGSIGKQKAFFPIEHEWIFIFGTDFKDINRTEERNSPLRSKRSKHREKDGSLKEHSVGLQEEFKEMGTIVYVPTQRDSDLDHPAVFPVLLPEKFILSMTQMNDIVVDPFLGSGSTLIACEKTGRNCYSVELDPYYFDMAIKRWEDYTLKKAVKVI